MILLKQALPEVFDHNLLETEDDAVTHIYCDMDGVLVDFDNGFKQIAGGKLPSYFDETNQSQKIWTTIASQPNQGIDWWANLPKTNDCDVLWKYITTNYSIVKILSSTGSRKSKSNSADIGKRRWLMTHLVPTPDDSKIILVDSSEAKQKYALGPNHVLIDDLTSNIQQWRAAGGIAIMHVSAENTINQLKRLQSSSKQESYGYSWSNV